MKNTYGGVLHLVKFQVKPGLRFLIRHFFFFFLFVVRSKYLFLSFIHKKNYHLNLILFKPGQIVRLDKVNVRPDIRQNLFLKKIWTLRVCVALKTIWNYFTLINIKLRQAHFCQHSVEPQQFLKNTQSPSLKFFAYFASKLNLRPNKNFKNQETGCL